MGEFPTLTGGALMAAAIRLAAVDGKRVRGIKPGRLAPARPPASLVKLLEGLAARTKHSEAVVKALHLAADPEATAPDLIVVRALARSALVEMNGLGNLADYLADILPDPSRW